MKLNIYRVIAFVLLIPLSIGFGFAFDGVATAMEKHNYPQNEAVAPLVEEYAEEYGLPEHILWATVKTASNFVSNSVSSDGRVGLMQLDGKTFSFICTELQKGEALNEGMLYDPKTNLRAGAEWLSYLYRRYGVWETAFAAYYIGTDSVDAWLAQKDLLSPQGTLLKIPDDATAHFVEELSHAAELYEALYYHA